MHFTGTKKHILETLFWWIFIYGGTEEVFKEDGNEMTESKQSTRYTDLKEKKTTNQTQKAKGVLPVEHWKKGKGYV